MPISIGFKIGIFAWSSRVFARPSWKYGAVSSSPPQAGGLEGSRQGRRLRWNGLALGRGFVGQDLDSNAYLICIYHYIYRI